MNWPLLITVAFHERYLESVRQPDSQQRQHQTPHIVLYFKSVSLVLARATTCCLLCVTFSMSVFQDPKQVKRLCHPVPFQTMCNVCLCYSMQLKWHATTKHAFFNIICFVILFLLIFSSVSKENHVVWSRSGSYKHSILLAQFFFIKEYLRLVLKKWCIIGVISFPTLFQ